MTRSLLLAVVILLFGQGTLAAQLNKIGEITLAPNESARGVSFEWPYAYVSVFGDGVQYKIDLTVPASPTLVATFNPAFGDQWAENLVAGGRLVSGHRFGGLNLWDVAGTPTPLDSVSTNYHLDGLARLPFGNMEMLLYSEHNAGNNPGGLRVYDIAGNALVPVSTNLMGNNLRDGRFLVITQDRWVYQLDGGAGSARPLMLNIYDLTNPYAPVMVQQFNMGNAVGGYPGMTDLQLDPTEGYLYAACGYDGLRVLDISNRANPVVINTLSGNNVQVRELSWAYGTVYQVGTVRFGNGQERFRVLDCSTPQVPIPIWIWFGDPNYRIHDLKAEALATGPTVLVAGQNAAGDATLQVWM